MPKSQYESLFSPGRIGTLELKNRIVYPPMGTNVCEGGEVTDRFLAYHEARAKGGVGLIIVENANVDTAGASRAALRAEYRRRQVYPGIDEAGPDHQEEWCQGLPANLPRLHLGQGRAKAGDGGGAAPRAISRRYPIHYPEFVEGARRAKEAGFDAIEIHGANINGQTQFRSRVWNTLKNKYGGSVENRARFMCDTLKAVRKEVGKNFPLWCRTSIYEVYYVKGGKVAEYGVTLQDTLIQAAHVR